MSLETCGSTDPAISIHEPGSRAGLNHGYRSACAIACSTSSAIMR